MALTFPTDQSPFTIGGQTYVWDATLGVYTAQNSAEYTQSTTPPSNPQIGDEWMSDGGRLHKYLSDGTNEAWLDVGAGGNSPVVAGGGGSLVLIESSIVSSPQASVEFNTGITGYDNYILYYDCELAGTGNLSFYFQDGSTDVTASNYEWRFQYNGNSTGVSTTNRIDLCTISATTNIKGTLNISCSNDLATVEGTLITNDVSDGLMYSLCGGGRLKLEDYTPTNINGFKLIRSGQNINSGKFSLYGVAS